MENRRGMVPVSALLIFGVMVFFILVYIHLRGMVCFNFLPMNICGTLGMP